MDPALIVSVIALLTSFSGPIITLLLNNYHQRKSKQQDFLLDHSYAALDEFLSAAGLSYQCRTQESISRLSSAYARLLPYLPSSLFETAYGIYHELSGGSPSIRVIQRMEALAKELRSTGVLLGK